LLQGDYAVLRNAAGHREWGVRHTILRAAEEIVGGLYGGDKTS
jgi:hypothetical protein